MSFKNDEYLNFIRKNPCLVCHLSGRPTGLAAEAHHESVSTINRHHKRGNDYATVPLCKIHHDQRHAIGFDTFWKIVGDYLGEREKSPFFIAASLVSMYLLEFLDKITSDLAPDEHERLLAEISSKLDDVFNTGDDITEAQLRKMLDILTQYAHEQYTMRFRGEVN